MKKLVILILLTLLSCITVPARYYMLQKVEYWCIYDCTLGLSRQTVWTLHSFDLGNAKRAKSWKFKADIPLREAKARHTDFTNSGFERGHLCPAQDRSSSASAMRSTFAMSNVAAQTQTLNDGEWKRTESQCRQFAQIYDSVIVVTVPVFLDRDTTFIGRNRVAVPHGFFKTVITAKTDSVLQTWFFFNR